MTESVGARGSHLAPNSLRRMGVRSSRRLAAVAGPVVVAAFLLGACGGSSDASPSATTLLLDSSTAFATLPPATTTTTIPGAEDGAAVVAGEQEYTIQAGDFPLGVAGRFDLTVEELAGYNGWANCSSAGCSSFPGPGTTIKIPPGAANPSAGTPAQDTGGQQVEVVTGGEAETAEPADPVGEPIPDAGDNCGPGRHVIQAGDIPIRVAEIYDVTLEALNEANANNPAYQTFIPGQELIIPPKADC